MTTQKPWGTSTRELQTDTLIVERIEVKPGGLCSRHYHANKFNQFIVLSGVLELQRFSESDGDLRESMATALGAGMLPVTFTPGQWHRFRAITPVVALEIYWPTSGQLVDPEDIVRFQEAVVCQQ